MRFFILFVLITASGFAIEAPGLDSEQERARKAEPVKKSKPTTPAKPTSKPVVKRATPAEKPVVKPAPAVQATPTAPAPSVSTTPPPVEPAPVTAPTAPPVEPEPEIRKAEIPASTEEPFIDKAPLNPLFKVTKVHEVRTDKPIHAKGNKALEYEEKYWMFGAVTEEQREAKKGQYFVISWVNKGEARPVEARLEYRQVNTRDVVRTLSIQHPVADGANRSQFSVVGQAFREGGPIASYRFTLWSGGELLAESKSFIW